MDRTNLDAQVERILQSRTFARKEQLKALLQILANRYDMQAALQPTRVIRELWPDDPARQSKDLAAVVYRLRQALEEYYARQGASDPLRISLPRRAGEGTVEGGPREWIRVECREAFTPTAVLPPDQPPVPLPLVPEAPPVKAGSEPRTRLRWWSPGFLIGMAALLLAMPVLSMRVNRISGLVKSLEARVIPGAAERVPSPDVQQLCLQAHQFAILRTPKGLAKAIDSYTQAIARDPSYPDAYAGLAEAYTLLSQFSDVDAGASLKTAEAAADRAITLNPNLANAHAAKAFALFFWDWDISGSDAEFRRSLALDPNSEETHEWYASALHCRDDGAQTISQADEALRLSPASASVAAEDAYFRADFGDLSDGVKTLREIERSHPTLPDTAAYLAELDFSLGNYSAYVEDMRRYACLTNRPDDIAMADALAHGWELGGKTGLLQARVRELKSAVGKGDKPGFALAQTLVLLGQTQEALQYFRTSFNRHCILLNTMQDCPWAKPLLTDPGYASLLAQVRQRLHGGQPAHPHVVRVSIRLPN